jgi:antitoxin HigA-1
MEIAETLPPMHPGEMLREEYLIPLGISAGALAKACDVPRNRIERIAAEQRGITGDTAVRLARVLGTTPDFWMNLQSRYAIKMAVKASGKKLNKLQPIERVAA